MLGGSAVYAFVSNNAFHIKKIVVSYFAFIIHIHVYEIHLSTALCVLPTILNTERLG